MSTHIDKIQTNFKFHCLKQTARKLLFSQGNCICSFYFFIQNYADVRNQITNFNFGNRFWYCVPSNSMTEPRKLTTSRSKNGEKRVFENTSSKEMVTKTEENASLDLSTTTQPPPTTTTTMNSKLESH